MTMPARYHYGKARFYSLFTRGGSGAQTACDLLDHLPFDLREVGLAFRDDYFQHLGPSTPAFRPDVYRAMPVSYESVFP